MLTTTKDISFIPATVVPKSSTLTVGVKVIADTNRACGQRFSQLWLEGMKNSLKVIYDIDLKDNKLELDAWTILSIYNPIKFVGMACVPAIIAADSLFISLSYGLKKLSDSTNETIPSFLLAVAADFIGDIVILGHAAATIMLHAIYTVTSPLNYAIYPLMDYLEKEHGISKTTTAVSLGVLGAIALSLTCVEFAPIIAAVHMYTTPEQISFITNSTAVAFGLYCMKYWSSNDVNSRVEDLSAEVSEDVDEELATPDSLGALSA